MRRCRIGSERVDIRSEGDGDTERQTGLSEAAESLSQAPRPRFCPLVVDFSLALGNRGIEGIEWEDGREQTMETKEG